MTDNRIGAEGAKALSEMLKVNTTLNTLNLMSESEETMREVKKTVIIIVDGIGDEGAKALGEMLKVNTTMDVLNLGSKEEKRKEKEIKKKNE